MDLHTNRLGGKIPAELGRLVNLETLWLARNQLNGKIPVELGRLVHLRLLFLRETQLSGCVPANLQLQLSRDSDLGGVPFCEP